MNNNLLEKQKTVIVTNLAKNLVLARTVNNLTQSDIAKKANVSRATIAQIESGESDPQLSTIIAISTSLEISPVLLLMGKNDIEAIENLVENYQKKSIPEEDIEKMRQLLSSGIKKFRIKAAKMGAEISVKLDVPSKGAIIGTTAGGAIGSSLIPGLGTIIGASLGAFFSSKIERRKNKDKEV